MGSGHGGPICDATQPRQGETRHASGLSLTGRSCLLDGRRSETPDDLEFTGATDPNDDPFSRRRHDIREIGDVDLMSHQDEDSISRGVGSDDPLGLLPLAISPCR